MAVAHRKCDATAAWTRRSFLNRAVATAVAAPAFVSASRDSSWRQKSQSILAWIGTYSARGSSGVQQGQAARHSSIRNEPFDWVLPSLLSSRTMQNPAWRDLDRSSKYLYSANYIGNYDGLIPDLSVHLQSTIKMSSQLLNAVIFGETRPCIRDLCISVP